MKLHDVPTALRQRREDMGVTRPELAEKLGINKMTLYQRETGRAGTPVDEMERWAAALGCSIQALIEPLDHQTGNQ